MIVHVKHTVKFIIVYFVMAFVALRRVFLVSYLCRVYTSTGNYVDMI